MGEIVRSVAIHNGHPRLRLVTREVGAAVKILDSHAADFLGGCPPGELSIVFLTDPALAKIHADFMDDPGVTDVITFEGNPSTGQAGEICVSVDTAVRFVGPRPGKIPSDAWQNKFSAELTLYLIHGWLHLAGYDDLQPAKKRRMRTAEKRALTLLQRSEKLPAFRLRSQVGRTDRKSVPISPFSG